MNRDHNVSTTKDIHVTLFLAGILLAAFLQSPGRGAYLKVYYYSEKDCNELWLDFYDRTSSQVKRTLIHPNVTIFVPGMLGTGDRYFQVYLLDIKPLYDWVTKDKILYWFEWVEQKTEFPLGNPIYYSEHTESQFSNLTQNYLGNGYELVKESALLFGRSSMPAGLFEQIYRKDGQLWQYRPGFLWLLGALDPAGTIFYDAYEYQRLMHAIPIEEPTLNILPILLYLPEPPPDEQTAEPWILTLEIPGATYNDGVYGIWDDSLFVPLIGSYSASSVSILPTVVDVTEPVPLDSLVEAGYFEPSQTYHGAIYLDGLRIPDCTISPLVRIVPEPAVATFLLSLVFALISVPRPRFHKGLVP